MSGAKVVMEKSELTALDFKKLVECSANAIVTALAEFCDDDVMPQLVALEICRRHLITTTEHALAQEPEALAKFRSELEHHVGRLKSTVAS